MRTFIVVDSRQTQPSIGPPEANVFGPPETTTTLGGLQVFVYGYDVATRFG